MDLLGEDGVGYELAKKLDSNGGWRAWLGDSHYMQMAPYLNSSSTWKNFMSNAEDGNKSNSQIHLQLRVRALLFDKATASLHLRSSSSASLASLHPSYLQLHADDIYYSLEEDVDDWNRLEAQGAAITKALQMKDIEGTSSARSRFIANEVEGASSRSKNGDILDTWYSQWREKHLKDRMQWFSWRLAQRELPFGDREMYSRTPEGMSAYLMFLEKYRKKRRVIKVDRDLLSANSSRENVAGVQAECKVETGCSVDEDLCFFPETMFPSNCVPDNSVPGQGNEDDNPGVEVPGIFENLPFETTRSPLLIERFGMGSEYLSLGGRKVDNTGKGRAAGKRKILSEEEATYGARQAVVRIVEAAGFEGLREGSIDVLSQLLSCHICKLGQTLRLLADSFRNHYTQIELLRMFLHTIVDSNLGKLMNYIKSEKRLSPQQTQQQLGRVTQAQRTMIVPPVQQQLQRQLSQQNMTLPSQQSSWDKLRRKQFLMPRTIGRKLEKERTMGDAKLETYNDSTADCKVAAPLVSQHHAQWQHQQQQQHQSVQMSHHSQSLPQFKQHPSLQLTQIQQQNLFSRDIVQMRTQPVKVEGFQELMGGDVNVKEADDEIGRTLLSPRKL